MMLGETDVRSIDACRGSFSSSQVSAGPEIFGSRLEHVAVVLRHVRRRQRGEPLEVGGAWCR